MQIKCQLGEDMKHLLYQLLKSLYLERRVCAGLVIAVACSVLWRKYIPYPIYQACLGQYSRITSSVSHELRRYRAVPVLGNSNQINERHQICQETTY